MWLYIAVFLLFVLLFVFAWLFFRKAFLRPQTKDILDESVLMTSELFSYAALLRPALEWFQKQSWDELQLTAQDGAVLKALWLPGREGRVCLLLLHGYGGLPQDLSYVARWAAKKGWSVLLPYQRAHGPSGGKYCTMGLREAEDCCLWAEEAKRRLPGGKLLLYGSGMGAFSALYSISKGLKDVSAVISDGAFDSSRGIMKTVLRDQMRMRVFPLLQILCLYGQLLWKRSPRSGSLTETLKRNTEIPVLFTHGKQDIRVPYTMSEAASEACAAEHALFLSEKAGHGAVPLAEDSAFFAKVQEFLKPVLSEGKTPGIRK